MTSFTTMTAALVLGLAIAAAASPASAAQRRAVHPNPGHAANAQAVDGDLGEAAMTKAREDAIRECSEKAGKMLQTTWGNTQSIMYRTCMAGHGQAE